MDWEGLAIYSVGDWVNGAITESQGTGSGRRFGGGGGNTSVINTNVFFFMATFGLL